MANKGFICFDGYLKRTSKLSDEEVGRLFRACMIYHSTGQVTELQGRESVAFDFIREDIDAANEAYKTKCEKNRANVESRWANTTAYDRIRPNTNAETSIPTNTNECNKKEKEKENENIKENKKDLLAGFDEFWKQYPKKVAKPNAIKAWSKLSHQEEIPKIMEGLQRWKNSDQWCRDDGRYIPHPATWLNGRRWEDEVTPARRLPAINAQNFEQRDYSRVPDQLMADLTAEIAAFNAAGET